MGAINIHKYSAITFPDKTEVSPLMANVNSVQYCNNELLINLLYDCVIICHYGAITSSKGIPECKQFANGLKSVTNQTEIFIYLRYFRKV